jgi:hypothetical protein
MVQPEEKAPASTRKSVFACSLTYLGKSYSSGDDLSGFTQLFVGPASAYETERSVSFATFSRVIVVLVQLRNFLSSTR